jgi:hypothetical protein
VIVFITDNLTLMFDSQNIVRIKTGTGVGANKGTNKGGRKMWEGGFYFLSIFCSVLVFHLFIS